MKFRSLFTFIALFLCAGLMAQSVPDRATQRAKNRAENRANQRVDQKVDRAVDDTFNAVGNLFKKKKKVGAEAETPKPTSTQAPAKPKSTGGAASEEETAQTISNMLGGGGDDEPYEGFTNETTFSVDMKIEETKKNGKKNLTSIKMAVDKDEFAVVILDENQAQVSRMIFNTETGKTTMITTDKKGKTSGFRMKMPGTRSVAAQAAEDMHDRFSFERTGERQTVDGYNCELYIVTDKKEGTVTRSWVTKDVNLNSRDVYGGMLRALGNRNAGRGPNELLNADFDGFPIKSTTEDNGKTYVTHYTNIKVGEANYDRSLMSTDGVQIQELGF